MNVSCQQISQSDDVPARLYNVAASLRALADLMHLKDDPLASLMELIGNEIEDCAGWAEDIEEFSSAYIDAHETPVLAMAEPAEEPAP